ncbi:MAG: HpcH/HpaI aldolase family protein [Anaerolineales bacterium]
MRTSKTLAKLRAGKPVKLAYLSNLIPAFVAHAAHQGYDAIWLEMEHRPMNPREVQLLLPLFHHYDIDAILRVPTREHMALYRFLEDGASGLIFPLVHSVVEARDLVGKVKYPPLGDRGLEGRNLDANYGLATADMQAKLDFIAQANAQTATVIQLESPQAVRAADEIAALEGVDVLFLGPTDFEIRAAHDPDAMTWPEALQHVAQACETHGKSWGVMPRSLDEVSDYAKQGARFIPWGIDMRMIAGGLAEHAAQLRDIYGE